MKNPLKEVTFPKKEKKVDYFYRRKKYVPGTDSVYFDFCKRNGFIPSNEKSIVALKKEEKVYKEEQIQKKLSREEEAIQKNSTVKKKMRKLNKENVISLIPNAYLVEIEKNQIEEEVCSLALSLGIGLKKLTKKQELGYKYLDRNGENSIWRVLINIAINKDVWQNNIREFQRKGRPLRQ